MRGAGPLKYIAVQRPRLRIDQPAHQPIRRQRRWDPNKWTVCKVCGHRFKVIIE